jgi:hypothetical protein
MQKRLLSPLKTIYISLLFTGAFLYAEEVSSEQAVFAVSMWQQGKVSQMRGNLSSPNGEVSSLIVNGATACHVVSLKNGGFVITSGDDCDPVAIRGFSDDGHFNPDIDSPLKNLLVASSVPFSESLSGRAYGVSENSDATFVQKTVDLSRLQCGNSYSASQAWKNLLSPSILKAYVNGVSTVDDLCVAPLVKANWNQEGVNGKLVYNYYTPKNYPCGCVATAMAQVMRHHEYPKNAVSKKFNGIYIDSEYNLKYVYSKGGVYDWANMPYNPSSSITDVEREAIGKLTYDCGVAVHMLYTSQGSGAAVHEAAAGFMDAFDYQNAMYITADYPPYSDIYPYTDIYKRAIIANLNAGYPVLLGIREGLENGHCIVSDGYGYIGENIYYHLNMGWSGVYNLWYTLPEIKNAFNFNVLSSIVYNIFPTSSGEVVSGRIVDESGEPLKGVKVKLDSGNNSQTVETNERGIWAAIVNSSKSYTVSTDVRGYVSKTKTTEVVAKSVSANYPQDAVVGNIWNCDFVLDKTQMTLQKITSFNVGGLLSDGTRCLNFGFASDLMDVEIYFSGEVDGSYKAIPSSAVSVSGDGLSATAVLSGEDASRSSGFVQILGR